ncbi:SsrA-binding protein SmpB [Balneatrix alpica]|uniref:SsrA-binding protein n=1 Tax=Balneatrix alpica TaxID=75684 RepID=A0ABV5ZBG5_9GAMM|nr:SsrA-binding protein SmpB [Balneatrix alpica]
MSKKKKSSGDNVIAQNKRARHDYHIEERFEAGVALMGWEVKSLRAGRASLVDTYVLVKDGEVWLVGTHISPLLSASTHVVCNPLRDRKLLLHGREIDRLATAISQKGYTCVPLSLYWKGHLVKCDIALVKGKKEYDKRDTERERDWQRQKERLMKHG